MKHAFFLEISVGILRYMITEAASSENFNFSKVPITGLPEKVFISLLSNFLGIFSDGTK